MSFLTPLFFLGALAVALPILFHFIRASAKERTVFSSLMFLQPSPPRLTRRSRLENLLLLALRCAALCILALGFARPFLRSASPPANPANSARQVLLLLDSSASMRRQDLWATARRRAEEIAQKAGPADAIALYTFDRRLKPLVTFDQWHARAAGDRPGLLRSRLADANPGWSGTGLDSAMIEAAELFGDRAQEEFSGRRQVVVISDFQEGSHIGALQGHEWPRGIEIVQERIGPRPSSNAGIQLVTDASEFTVAGDASIRVRVSNAPDSKREQFQAGWAGTDGAYVGKPADIYVPAGQSRTVSIPLPATNVLTDRVVLRGDDEPFDNTVFVVPPERSELRVIYLGKDLGTDSREPRFFLERALQDTRRQAVRIVAHDLSVPLNQAEIQPATLLVLTAPVGDSQVAELKDAVESGKTLLFAPTTAEAATSLGKILNAELPAVEENKLSGYAMLAQLEFRHPLFAPFADSRFSDFTKIHFWQYRRFDPSPLSNARVVARFDTGDPAILDIPAGKGRVVVFASGWHPADSQLALSSKFVPLLYALVELSGSKPPPPRQFFIGSTITLPSAGHGPIAPDTIRLPNGSTARLAAGETNFDQAFEPGIYTIISAASSSRFAVNLDPAESRTAPLPPDELDRLGVPGPAAVPSAVHEAERKVRFENAELEARQKLWRWVILTALGVLVLETWVGGWTLRRATLRGQAP